MKKVLVCDITFPVYGSFSKSFDINNSFEFLEFMISVYDFVNDSSVEKFSINLIDID